jgi:hypothetical protein
MERPPRDQLQRDQLQPRDPARLRISDEDRHQVAEVLRIAAGDGRIDLQELDERLEATYAAKTYADLVPLTVDLPATPNAVVLPTMPAVGRPPIRAYTSSFAVMSENKRVGPWQVGAQHGAFALMGAVRLDLREALFDGLELVVNACAIMGEVSVVVNAATVVMVDGVGIMGEFNEQRPKTPHTPTAGAPVVRVRGFALMGAVHVQRKAMPGRPRLRS